MIDVLLDHNFEQQDDHDIARGLEQLRVVGEPFVLLEHVADSVMFAQK